MMRSKIVVGTYLAVILATLTLPRHRRGSLTTALQRFLGS